MNEHDDKHLTHSLHPNWCNRLQNATQVHTVDHVAAPAVTQTIQSKVHCAEDTMIG